MAQRVYLVHYNEIGLKGQNRHLFIDKLVHNIWAQLHQWGSDFSLHKLSGFLLITRKDADVPSDLIHTLCSLPGVARVSYALRCSREKEDFIPAALQVMEEAEGFETFKVYARKSSSTYELHCVEINALVGSALCERFPEKRVDVHNPDLTVRVHFIRSHVYVYAQSLPGVGGLPVGSAEKVISLLSSGIDSPVATWRIGRRGAICIGLHFSARPMASDASEWLVQDIVQTLAASGVVGRLYVVPFGEFQREIALAVPNKLRILMYRRLMYTIANELARIESAKALVTGESLGQVASQTLDNIAAVSTEVDRPILRPLIGSDKLEIIADAKRIGTYDISAQDAEDCCTLFMPDHPETHAHMPEVLKAWDAFDHERMVVQALDQIEWLDLPSCTGYRPPRTRFTEVHDTLLPE